MAIVTAAVLKVRRALAAGERGGHLGPLRREGDRSPAGVAGPAAERIAGGADQRLGQREGGPLLADPVRPLEAVGVVDATAPERHALPLLLVEPLDLLHQFVLRLSTGARAAGAPVVFGDA
jgi:hypothetical protein